MGNVKYKKACFVLQKTTRKSGNTIWGLSLPGSDRISPSICVPPVERTSYFWNPQNECLAEHQGPSNKLQCHAVHSNSIWRRRRRLFFLLWPSTALLNLKKIEYHSSFKSFFCYCFFLFPKIHLFYNYFPENYSICPPA